MFSAYENSLYYKNKERFKDLEDAINEIEEKHLFLFYSKKSKRKSEFSLYTFPFA